jgi:DNA-binding PucR family transcriptional regulator
VDALQRIASTALGDTGALTDTLVAAIGAELPELATDMRARELFHATVLDSVVAALRALTSGTDGADYAAPPVALEFARRLAQQGVPLTTMLRAYRLGQAALLEQVFAAIAAEQLPAAEIAHASMTLSSFGFAFIDTITEQVVVAYQLERDAWLRQRNATRLAKVQSVLNGKLTELGEIEKALGISLARTVVGAVVWSGEESGEADRVGRLERHVSQLAAALGGHPRAVLSVAPDDATVWAWIPVPSSGIDAGAAATQLADSSLRAAVGSPAAGLAGFRATHRQARQAQSLAMAADPAQARPLLASSELGPLALVATDVDGVRSWVQDVLGGLAMDDDNCARLRETVWAYLSSGGSPNTAAAELHLHKNTIQYRIRKAEEARGRPLAEGRIDVEVALLACRLLGRTVLTPAD